MVRVWKISTKPIHRGEINSENVKKYDAVVIATDHSSIDYNKLVEDAQLVLDTRNATKNVGNFRIDRFFL
jgi:UDP-N-acetyl-D-mannosaminuronate dehydrogenase